MSDDIYFLDVSYPQRMIGVGSCWMGESGLDFVGVVLSEVLRGGMEFGVGGFMVE